MAEAAAVVGLIASIASLVDLSVKVVVRINDFASQTSEVPQTFRLLASRLPLLSQTLRHIQTRANAGQVQASIAKELDKLVSDILDQSLSKDERVRKAIEEIHRGIDVLTLFQSTNTVELSDRIIQQLAQLNLTSASTSASASTSLQQTFGLCLGQAPQIEPDAFVGRTTEIQTLFDWLSPESHLQTQNVVSIVGMGGLGKTQLSLAYARQHGHHYSSVFWINAKDLLSLRQGMSALGSIVFPNEATTTRSTDDEDSQIGRVRRWLSEPWNHQWLVIFDNYDDPSLPGVRSPTGYDIRSVFPHRAQGSILITTRSPRLTFAKRLVLQKLDDIDLGVAVLSQRSGRETDHDEHARQLAVRLDGLPLALAIAGTYIGQTNVTRSEYLEAYDSAWMELYGQDAETLLEYEDPTLSSTWTVSLNHVSRQDGDAAELLKFCAFMNNQDVWYDLIHAGAGYGVGWIDRVTATKVRFDRAMARLRDYSLVEVVSGSYYIHPCVHDWLFENFCKPSVDAFLIALQCVTSNILDSEHAQSWMTRRRTLQHLVRLDQPRFQGLWEVCMSNETMLDACYKFGIFYNNQDKFAEAEQMILRALAGREKVFGSDHITTLKAAHALSRTFRIQGKLVEALPLLLRALSGYEKTVGPENVLTLQATSDLAGLYDVQGKLEEAEQIFLRVLAKQEKVLGLEHSSTLVTVQNLGILYVGQGKLSEAEQLCLRALAGTEKLSGIEYSSALDPTYKLGIVYAKQGRPIEAEQMFLRALATREKVLGSEHTMTLNIVTALGFLYEDQGKFTEAEQMYLRAFTGFEKAMGPGHRSTLDLVEYLGRFYNDHDRTVRLIQLTSRYGSRVTLLLGYLGRILLQLADELNARIVFQQQIKFSDGALLFNRIFCDKCRQPMPCMGKRYVCRQCADVDLCGECWTVHQTGTHKLDTCLDHTFFEISPQTTSCYTVHDWLAQRDDRGSWYQDLAAKYSNSSPPHLTEERSQKN